MTVRLLEGRSQTSRSAHGAASFSYLIHGQCLVQERSRDNVPVDRGLIFRLVSCAIFVPHFLSVLSELLTKKCGTKKSGRSQNTFGANALALAVLRRLDLSAFPAAVIRSSAGPSLLRIVVAIESQEASLVSNKLTDGPRRMAIPRSRRLVIDLMRLHKQVPTTAHDRICDLSVAAAARADANARVSWPMLFIKAYG